MHAFLIVGQEKETKEKIDEILKREKIDRMSCIFQDPQDYTIAGIKSLQNQLIYKSGQKRAVIIQQANELTPEAINALLKTIEEPPENTIIILTSPTEFLLPETIVSRCQKISLRRADDDNYQDSLEKFTKICRMSLGERIEFIEELGKSREESLNFCLSQLYLMHQILTNQQKIEKIKSLDLEKVSKLTKKILETINKLKKNINSKMLLFELILEYPGLDNN